jgi:hypothetical protein
MSESKRRIVEIATTRFTRVVAVDGPGAGGASHAYEVEVPFYDGEPPHHVDSSPALVGSVRFAHGPITNNADLMGVFNEDLLAMVLDRLYAFQAGDFRCRENAIAITKIEEAMLWLGKRVADRERRGVLGTEKV